MAGARNPVAPGFSGLLNSFQLNLSTKKPLENQIYIHARVITVFLRCQHFERLDFRQIKSINNQLSKYYDLERIERSQ